MTSRRAIAQVAEQRAALGSAAFGVPEALLLADVDARQAVAAEAADGDAARGRDDDDDDDAPGDGDGVGAGDDDAASRGGQLFVNACFY